MADNILFVGVTEQITFYMSEATIGRALGVVLHIIMLRFETFLLKTL